MKNFYPSITTDLLHKSVQFVKEVSDTEVSELTVSDNEIIIVMQSRKTLLFNELQNMRKSYGDEDFDVPMGCCDGADI